MSFASQFMMVFSRYCMLALRNPFVMLLSMLQPLLYLFLFGPLLSGIRSVGVEAGGNSYDVYVPALAIQLALFGGAFTGLTLLTEFRQGVLDRMLATPVSRGALLGGRVLRDALLITIQAAILIACSFLLGTSFTLLGIVLTLGLVLLTSTSLSSVSYLIALITKSESSLSAVFNAALLPVLLLSGTMLPMTLAPQWLAWISRLDPLSYIVDGARGAFNGNAGVVLIGYAVSLVLGVVTFLLATRRLAFVP